jgi:hypothetical protein
MLKARHPFRSLKQRSPPIRGEGYCLPAVLSRTFTVAYCNFVPAFTAKLQLHYCLQLTPATAGDKAEQTKTRQQHRVCLRLWYSSRWLPWSLSDEKRLQAPGCVTRRRRQADQVSSETSTERIRLRLPCLSRVQSKYKTRIAYARI